MAFQNVGIRLTIIGVGQFRRDVASVSREMNTLNRSLGTMGGPLASLSGGLNTLGNTFVSTGRMLTTGLTIPLGLLATGLVAAGISFEDAFSGVSKTVEGVADDFGTLTPLGEKLRKELIDLSLQLPISANELARVAQAAGQVGVSADNLLEFTAIAAKMGVATNISSEDAAIGLARLANILGITQEDFVGWSKRAASVIVDLGNNVAATESGILNLALRIAPAANIVGLTTQEMLGLSAALAEVGVKSERGGTAVSRVFLEMAEAAGGAKVATLDYENSVANMQPALERLRTLIASGVTNFNDLQFQLRDTGLDLTGLSGMLDGLGGDGGAFDNLNSQIQKSNITIQGYKRDIGVLQAELNRANNEYAEGTITVEEHAEILNRINPRLADLNDNLRKAEITAGDYNRRMSELNTGMTTIDDIIRQVSQNTLMQFEDAMSDTSSKIATFARIMGVTKEEFAASFGAKPLETFKRFLVELARLQDEGKISAETLAEIGLSGVRVREILNILGPNINLVTDNIAMSNAEWVKATALQVEVQKKFATTKSQIQLLKNNVVALGIALFDNLKPSIDGTIKSLIDLIQKFKDFLFGPLDTIPKKVEGVTYTVEELQAALDRDNFVNKFRGSFKKILLILAALGPGLTVVGIAFKGLSSIFWGLSRASGVLSLALKPISLAFKFLGPNLLLLLNPLKLLKTAFGGIMLAIKALASPLTLLKVLFASPLLPIAALIAAVTGIYLAIKNNFLGIQDLFATLERSMAQFSGVHLALKTAFSALLSGDIETAIDQLKLAWEEFTTWFTTFGIPILNDWVKQAGPKLVDWISDAIPKALEALGNFLGKIGDWIFFTALPWLGDKIKAWVPAFVDWVIEIWPKLTEKLKSFLENGLIPWIEEKGPILLDKLWEWAKAFFNWVIDVGPQLAINLGTLLAYLLGWIIGVALWLDNKLYLEWIPALTEWVIEKGWPALKDELDKFLDKFVDWIETTAKDDIVAAFNSIGHAMEEVGRNLSDMLKKGIAEGLGIDIADLDKFDKFFSKIWNTDWAMWASGEIKDLLKGDKSQNEIAAEHWGRLQSLGLNNNQEALEAARRILGNAGSLNTSGALGGTTSSSIVNSSSSSSTTFAPTINGVPMVNEEAAGAEILRAWRMAQTQAVG